MHDSTIAKRYASALAELAAEQNALEVVGQDLAQFNELIAETPAFAQLLTNPTAAKSEQHAALTTYIDKAEPQPVSANFLRLLLDKRRMNIFSDIVAAYQRDLDARAGKIAVRVQTPKALLKRQSDALGASLSAATGKQVELELEEKPELLGGLVVQVGSVMMDYSVRNQLHRLKEIMKG
ncbi:ATP synthase F1 subunit delta [Magnetofaba australis]|uniref:ATP synthase subunit delta n=1 Tax=Magnetofaba australis IT-1 TaxID=1434232 RepID=A0A1Y2JYR4_9PROT|nr:ATP synthase F1 subunit delta [Magnetofaba australis]OSM00029.1 putative ATP synthase F1 subunit delta [Magnetofaba australis IT-1]